MKKRLLTVLLAVCLVLALGTVTAMADDAVASVGGTEYSTLQGAIDAAEKAGSGTITLLRSVESEEITFDTSGEYILDLAGKTFTSNGDDIIEVKAGDFDLTIRNGRLWGPKAGTYGIYAYATNNDVTITLESVYLYATDQGLGVQGLNTNNNLIVRNSTVRCDGTAIYFPPISGDLVIEDSTITGVNNGIYVKGGNVTVSGNSRVSVTGQGNGVPGSAYTGGSGFPSTGIAIYAEGGYVASDGSPRPINVTIEGGTIESVSHVAVSEGHISNEDVQKLEIVGGTFLTNNSKSNVGAYIPEGSVLKQDDNGAVVVDGDMTAVARVDGIGFTDLAKAIAAADDGDTVTLLEDVDIDSTIVIDKGIEFDLGGNTITVVSPDSWASSGVRNALSFTSGNSVIKNGRILDVRSMDNTTGNWGIAAISGSASLTTESIEMQTYQPSSGAYYNYILRAAATNAGEGTLTLNAGTVLSELPKTSPEAETYGAVAVSVLGKYDNSTVTNIEDGYVGEKLVINEGVIIDTTGFAVTGNGAAHGTTIEINGGVLSSGSLAIYHPQVGNLTVNGGTLTGEFAGIEVRAGNVVINDGTITSTSDTFNCDPNGNGTTTTGAALAIAQHTTKQGISVEINGGTFNGIRAVNEANPQENDPAPNVDISIKDGEYIGEISAVDVDNFISGGSFSDPVSPEYLDDGLNAELYSRSNSDTPYSYYSNVEEAMDAAQPGDIVTDLSKVTSDTRYNVTFNYGNNDSETVSVSAGATITFTAPTRSGYEFRGWRDNSGKLHKAGETVTVNSDMVFTAVWSAINIPDTYDIEIADAANGEVDTSLSNASAGSTITITATPDSGYSVASVTVTGPDGRVDVTRVNATTYTFKRPAGDVTVRVTFTDSDALPFTDVSANQWFYDAISYVYTNGMMEGDSATTFNPDGTMTRAMFWAVLGRIDGATITGTNWADQAREWAMAEGVSDGTDPNGLVTREQMVTMLWRYAGEPESTVSLSAYTDAESVSDWAETAMRWAIDEGIITGMTDTTLVPQGTATRAQCAAIFMRFDQM